MANIPGISGFIQPGAFARDRVVSRSVSIPGGIRVVSVLGEGLREETIVQSAAGGGADGESSWSPTGSGDGRFFELSNVPVISGRTELRLNGTLLFGKQEVIDSSGVSSPFDYRLDISNGRIELRGASIGDQDGKGYSAGSGNVGTGILVDNDSCDPLLTLDILDDSAPSERWTIRCVSVVRDSNGDPIPGLATFTATGDTSGQLYDSFGNPLTFSSAYFTSTAGAVSGNLSECDDGVVVASGSVSVTDFPRGSVVLRDGDDTLATSDTFMVSGADLVSQGQALPGDFLCLDGYVGHEIETITYDGTDTTITVTTDSLGPASPVWDEADLYDWDIRATNILIDDPSVTHNGLTGAPASEGNFSSADVGKTVLICNGGAFDGGLFTISKVTSTRRVRLHSLDDATVGFQDLEEASGASVTGLAAEGLTFHLLENNGVLLLGIQEGATSFEVGDKFFVDISSRALGRGDTLEAKYIATIDLNDPEFFVEASDLFRKHGLPSVENTLSLGTQIALENGAPGILALQCKPPVPRRTSVTLLEERNSLGEGGFSACYDSGTLSADACEVDDLRFTIPRPLTGLRNGRPDPDTRVNIFVIRDGEETQVFPNKSAFYNSQLTTDIQQGQWIDSSDSAFSYTVVDAVLEVVGNGDEGSLDVESGSEYFTTPEIDFDGDNVGHVIVISSMEDSDTGIVHTSVEDISMELFGVALGTPSVELVIDSVTDDSLVLVSAENGSPLDLQGSYSDIQFFIKDPEDSNADDALLLLHSDLVSSGVIKEGDGLRISYIDENDADFFDTNWFDALEAMEAAEAQIIVPLPNQAISSIFRATVNHCENMSSVANRKERMAFIGAQIGVTPAALIGTREIAIEDIGIIEGIQGDDAEEILDGNVEDLVNFKLSDNYTSNRSVYLFPDSIVRNVNGTNVNLHGFYQGAAAAGFLSAKQNVAIPLTDKPLSGFSITRDKVYSPTILNQLGGVGATVLQPITGGGRVLAGRTTSTSGFIEDEEISIIFIRDSVKRTLRSSLRPFIGGVQNADTNILMGGRVRTIMNGLIGQGLVTSFKNIRVEQDKVDPRQINVFLQFAPAYPINYVFIDIEVGVI
jgi:hypothetical protein